MVLRSLFVLDDSIIVYFDVIINLITVGGWIDRIASTEGMAARAFVLIFSGILKGNPSDPGSCRGVE